VIHTHTTAGIAVSAQRDGLLPISQHALKFYGKLAYHEYEGIALDTEERERLVAALGSHQAMILRNHGLLAAGSRWRRPSMKSISWNGPARRRWRRKRAGQPCTGGGMRLRAARQFDNDQASGIIDLAWEAAYGWCRRPGRVSLLSASPVQSPALQTPASMMRALS
jgi:rhamnose utilization protein RhaD (predicted bifunctional aldolase and dehydrogenase)